MRWWIWQMEAKNQIILSVKTILAEWEQFLVCLVSLKLSRWISGTKNAKREEKECLACTEPVAESVDRMMQARKQRKASRSNQSQSGARQALVYREAAPGRLLSFAVKQNGVVFRLPCCTLDQKRHKHFTNYKNNFAVFFKVTQKTLLLYLFFQYIIAQHENNSNSPYFAW